MFESIVTLIVLVRLFSPWFFWVSLSGGDWLMYFPDALRSLPVFYLWSTMHDGLGASIAHSLWVESYFASTSRIAAGVGVSWVWIERIFWFIPYILFSFFSTFIFLGSFSLAFWARLIGSIIYISNSYALLLVSGGQMGVALAYAFAPFVWVVFFRVFEHILLKKKSYLIFFSFAFFLGVLILFDLRIAYLTVIAFVLYFFLKICFELRGKQQLNGLLIGELCFKIFVVPLLIAAFLHAYWILPLIVYPISLADTISSAYTSLDALKFFSFSDFSHSLALLHPNWPENIFGKTYFLQPEFLIIPIFAFSALLFIGRKSVSVAQRGIVVTFALLGILGAFLAKGANEPLGNIYVWLFEHLPGFVMFRDPTKYYTLIALSYAVLIPNFLSQGSFWVQAVFRKRNIRINTSIVHHLIFIGFIIFWIVLHREAYTGKIAGTLYPIAVSSEYIQLAEYLKQEPNFSQVLWIPQRSRYGYFSLDKPSISLESLDVSSVSSFVTWISIVENREKLVRLGVSHIIVPFDAREELFVKDRIYDDQQRSAVIQALIKSGFHQVSGFSAIAVFTTQNFNNLFFFADNSFEKLSYTRNNPSKYSAMIPQSGNERKMIFSQHFDPYWVASLGSRIMYPTMSEDGLQEYILPSSASGELIVSYRPQKEALRGLWISYVTLISMIGFGFYDKISLWKKK